MTKKLIKATFFGSGPVAARALELLSKHIDVDTVITKTSTKKMMESALIGTKTYCVNNKTELDELIRSGNIKNRIGILIDFGVILSKEVIDFFEFGIINSHFSLLPEWRGADPITFSILSGQKTTGVSLMLVSEGLDEGKIIGQCKYDIPPNQNIRDLTENLIELSDLMLKNLYKPYLNDEIIPLSQDLAVELTGQNVRKTYSRKLTKKDGLIDWNEDAEVIERKIRAFYDWPKSYCNLNGLDLIIREVGVCNKDGNPGEYIVTKKEFIIYCGTKALSIKRIQPIGKKEMGVTEFIAGYSKKLK